MKEKSKKLWLAASKRVCTFVLRRWFPWQYDVESKLRSAPRHNIGKDCTDAYSRFMASWNRQRKLERLLGKRIMAFMRKRSGIRFYPTGAA